MTGATCDETRDAAAELALGVLDGEERARLLAHARGCPACRTHLDELALVGQEILTAAPLHEPPPGFESRVLQTLLPARRRLHHGRRLLLAVAATVLLAGGGATWITLSATNEERRLGAHYQGVLALAGGKYLVAAELRDGTGAKRGVVFAYQGDQPWVTIVLDPAAAEQAWRVGVSARTGAAHALGGFDSAGSPVWGHALPLAVREVASVTVTGEDGADLRAQLRSR